MHAVHAGSAGTTGTKVAELRSQKPSVLCFAHNEDFLICDTLSMQAGQTVVGDISSTSSAGTPNLVMICRLLPFWTCGEGAKPFAKKLIHPLYRESRGVKRSFIMPTIDQTSEILLF